MGIYRYVLAAVVVLFHFGGLSWVTGRVAVFGFYCVSGFLIFQVLDRVYLGERHGVPRFFLNRFVRLAPSYLLYTALTLLVVKAAGAAGLADPEGRPVLTGANEPGMSLLRDSLTFAPAVALDGWIPVVGFSPPLIPQGWSIGVELSFYIIAPLVVLTTMRRVPVVWLWIAAGLAAFLAAVRAAGLDYDQFQTVVYKNAVASWFVFFLGGAIYYARRRWGGPLRLEIVLVLVAAWAVLLLVPSLGWIAVPPRSPGVFTRYLWLTVLLAAVVCFTQARGWRTLDKAAGNLCYAIYLNHFVVAALLVWSDAPGVGVPGTLLFGGAVLLGSTGLAGLTYLLVERPFESLRARVRGEIGREAAGISLRLPLQAAAVVAGVVLAILATPPVGIFVERIGASAPEEATRVSAPFDIRWTPNVTDAGRLEIEQLLGLVDARQVMRDPRLRTWSYRLRQPTPDRVQAILKHPAVEDTAHIDMESLQIVE